MGLRYTFGSMGCPCAIELEDLPELKARAIAEAAHAEVERLNRKYSHYRDDSLLADWARAGGDEIALDAESAALLAFADTLYQQSAGRFDITAAPLTRLWDGQGGRLPSSAEIAAARAQCGWSRVLCTPERLQMPAGYRLDLGGIVKEYAADRAAALCRTQGARHGIVDLGGDLALIGPHADGSPWRIGIKDPRAPGTAIADIELDHGGLATSGDYERALVVDGVRYSHIVDPTSGWPIQSHASVSVVGPSCLIAGAASTLAMLLGEDAGLSYLRSLGLPFLCVSQSGACWR